MEASLSFPGTFARTGPPSEGDELEPPGVNPFDVAWTLSVLIYMLLIAVRDSGHA